MRTSNDRAQLRKRRIMRYFIEAADGIIREEGIGGVNIRKVADLAGYTSATLYNYFDDLSHLVFLAVGTHLDEYYKKLPGYTKWCSNSVERYLSVAEIFCEYAFSEPEIYELIFFTHSNEKLQEYTSQYYELFPEKVVQGNGSRLSQFFNISNMYMRSKIQLDDCIEEGFMTSENATDFNEITLMTFKCVLIAVKNGTLTAKEATCRMIRYYSQLFYAYTNSDRYQELTLSLRRLKEHAGDAIKDAYILTAPSEAWKAPA